LANTLSIRSGDGRRYRQVAAVALTVSVLAETAIFVILALVLCPEGSILSRFLGTVVFCGIGMGSLIAVALLAFVIDRFEGWEAIAATPVLTIVVLGGICNILCY